VLYPIVLSVVVVATANHYFLDVVAGVAAVGVGALIAQLFELFGWRLRRGSSPGATGSPPPTVPA
jgi:hypothetical protein